MGCETEPADSRPDLPVPRIEGSPVRSHTPRTFWPTATQRDLLAVAFSEPPSAVEKWSGLRPHFVLDDIEPGDFALLPLVYRNLTAGGHDDALAPRLKGIVRRTWVLNNLVLSSSKDVARALREAGLRAMLVEGPVLAGRFYPDLGMRPSSYFDVLVKASELEEATAPLTALGWQVDAADASWRKDRRVLTNEQGHRMVLRTSLSIDFTGPEGRESAHAPLWESAERLHDEEDEVLVPSRTDCLLALCVIHLRAELVSGPQWVADAKMVLEGEIDWSRLIAVARGGGQTLRLANALSYLAGVPGPSPPAEVLDELSDEPVSLRQKLVYDCTTARFRATGALPWLVAQHLSEAADESLVRATASFPAHLRDHWGLSHVWQVPVAAGRRAMRLKSRRSTAA